jgi:hypothetical protein
MKCKSLSWTRSISAGSAQARAAMGLDALALGVAEQPHRVSGKRGLPALVASLLIPFRRDLQLIALIQLSETGLDPQ